MKNYYLLKYLLFALVFLSCENRDEIEFLHKKNISGQPIKEITLSSKGNVNLSIADTFLVVQKAEEPFIQIYSTNTHKRLVEFGRKGREYGEFLGPSLKKQVTFANNNSPRVHIFDFKRKRLNSIDINKAINDSSVTKQEVLPSGSHWLSYFHYIGENLFVGTPYRAGRFIIHDYKSSQDTVVPYVPKPDFQIPEQRLSQVYRSAVVVNTEKDLIAAAPILLGEIDFFDLDGNYLRSTIFESSNKYSEKFSASSEVYKTLKFQIADLDSKNELIYGLNINSEITDFVDREGRYNMKVQVFDWEGQPRQEYVLDDRLITSFAIDEIHNRIYAYSPLDSEHPIIIYNIE